MEAVGGKWQTIFGIGMEGPWVFGWFVTALIAYLVQGSWRMIMIITSIQCIAVVCVLFFIPESPKWLLAVGKVKQAEKIVRKAAKINGNELPEEWHLNPILKEDEKKASFFDLFRHKNLALKTFILYFNWFANSFVYYGLTLNSGSLGGTVMVNFLLAGVTEIPAYIFSCWVLLKRGRKVPYVCMMITGGIALLCTMAVPKSEDENDGNWGAVTLALIGKLMITGCYKFSFCIKSFIFFFLGTFGIAYVYSAEIYPTVTRSVGIGSSSLFARLGGMVAPYVGSLGKYVDPVLPIVIFGLTAFIAGILALFLPETQGKKLPDTIEEGEDMKISFKDGLFKRNVK